MTNSLKCFAITGGIACGKSTVAAWLPRWGGDVLDADSVVHELEGVGGEAVEPIKKMFGPEVVQHDGAINRAVLGGRVFSDPGALTALNAIVHPLVQKRIKAWRRQPVTNAIRFRAVVIPLLFEVGWETDGWDAVIAIVCEEAEQIRRLRARGLSAPQAHQRISAQMDSAEKGRRADYAIWNHGTKESLYETTEKLFRRLLEKTT